MPKKIYDEEATQALLNACNYYYNDPNLEFVKACIAGGADVNADRSAPFMYACVYGRDDLLRVLLDAGSKVNVRAGQPLVRACGAGYLEIVRMLAEAGANLYAQKGEALPAAMQSGNRELVDFLLAQGMDPALHPFVTLDYAATVGDLALAKKMLEPEEVRTRAAGSWALDNSANRACVYGNLELLKLFHEVNPGITGNLNAAVKHGQWEIVRYIVEELGETVPPESLEYAREYPELYDYLKNKC